MLLDTQAWAWSFGETWRLTAVARLAMGGEAQTFVSAVTFYEMAYKAHLGKWPAMQARVSELEDLAASHAVRVIDTTASIAPYAATLDWPHRDPFDRLIAATALYRGLDLVSADSAFDSLPGLHRIW